MRTTKHYNQKPGLFRYQDCPTLPTDSTFGEYILFIETTLGRHMKPASCTAAPFLYLLSTHLLVTLVTEITLESPITIITLYREPVQGPIQARFNKHHSKARCIIEMSFGRIKALWRAIFLQTLPLDRLVVPKVVTACTMLHNIWLGVGDIMDDPVLEPTTRPRHVAEGMRLARREELAAVQRHNVLQEHNYI